MGVISAVPPAQDTNPDLLQWQRGLLPFMTYFIVAMAIAFFVFSGLHVYQVTRFIQGEHDEDIRSLVQNELSKPTGQALTPEDARQNSLLLLEADTLEKRYHQAGGLLISRIWSRQLAFITGMVMAFVGAVFILGKMSESVSQVSGGGSEWKVAISSASPGIILSFFGTALLISSLFVRASLDVSDGPAYTNGLHPASDANGVAPQKSAGTQDLVLPLDLKQLQQLDQQKRQSGQKPSGQRPSNPADAQEKTSHATPAH